MADMRDLGSRGEIRAGSSPVSCTKNRPTGSGNIMAKNKIKLYDGKIWGIEVSKYGLENGYLDYLTLARMVGDRILCNSIITEGNPDDWDLVSGDYDVGIFQYYIISELGATILYDLTDEPVYYNERFDIYVWGITHFGTGWDYVLTDVKIEGDD